MSKLPPSSSSSSSPSSFAAAVSPPAATTIVTDGQGIRSASVQIPTADGTIPGHASWPEGSAGASYPVVIVIQEIFGVHEHIRDVTRRLAKRGYLAVAPELFHRQGDVSGLDIERIRREVVARVPDEQVLADLDATVAWAKANQGDGARLGVTGFCWGGRITWLFAAHNPTVKAAVAWYGRLTGERTPLQPAHPIDKASALKAPVLGLYGGADAGIPLDTVAALRTALAGANDGPLSEVHVYPEAPHAFYADYRPSYRAAEAADGWARLLAWFERHGVR